MDRSLREDTALKFLGGMISKDTTKRPVWQEPMMKLLPEGCTLAYVGPGSPDNKTVMTIPNGVDTTRARAFGASNLHLRRQTSTNRQFVLSWRTQF